jgi:hypothetical protein
MKKIIIVYSLLLSASSQAADISRCKAPGINIATVTADSLETPYVDIAKGALPWIRIWNSKWAVDKIPLNLDSDGYLKTVDAGASQSVINPFINATANKNYVFLYDGEGTFSFDMNTPTIVSKQPGRIVLKLRDTNNFGINERSTNPDNYVKNIRVVPLEAENSYQEKPFRNDFIQRWNKFPVWRFMDFMKTNNSQIVTWDDRQTPSKFGSTGELPIEDIVALANQAEIAPWVNIPHLANDQYITELAKYFKAHLNPKLKVYIEYTNEAWNPGFLQYKYMVEQGKTLGIDSYQYYADRTLNIFKIWEKVYGGTDNIVRVVASQEAAPTISEEILAWKDLAKHTDALAIGAYFGYEYGAILIEKTLSMTPEQLLLTVRNESIPKSKTSLTAQKVIADKYHIPLIAYEAGQHLAPGGFSQNYGWLPDNKNLTDILTSANRLPMMYEAYLEYFKVWQDLGGGLLNWYLSTGKYVKYGSFGLLESLDKTDAPKYQAAINIQNTASTSTLNSCKFVKN